MGEKRWTLEAAGLGVIRGGRRVLSGATFSAAPGTFAALRGPNGSGKTTLLRALAGLTPIAEGDARLRSEAGETIALAEDADAFRQQAILAGHLDAVKPALSVRENLSFWTDFYGADPARIDPALERFGLSALAEEPAGWCSAGQKRRVGLARLAVGGRPIWLLDEPTVSLDAASVEALTALIESHCAAGGVVIAATHQDFAAPERQRIDVSALAGRPPGASLSDDASDDDDARPARAASADPFLDGDWKDL